MKKLVRGKAPLCLAKFRHGQDNWSVISKNKLGNDIWENLNIMQNGFCAYCECSLHQNNNFKGHIEHFIQKDKDPRVTFEWGNLFGSCNNPNRCGKYKDSNAVAKTIDLNKVCKPDDMDSSKLILFLNSGKVRPRNNLTTQETQFAENTIAVFNLNGDSALTNSRKYAILGEKSLADAYWEELAIANDEEGELAALLETELSEALVKIKELQHSTALRHLWTDNRQF